MRDVRTGSAMFACDASMRIVAWNDAAEHLVGVAAADAVGKPCWEVLRANDPDGALVCGASCARARLAAHGYPVEPHEIDVAAAGRRKRVHVDTLTSGNAGSRAVVHLLREAGPADDAAGDTTIRLTPRQLEVLRLLAEGRPAKAIGKELWLSEPTVRNHIRAILRELESHSQLEALSKARRLGLVA